MFLQFQVIPKMEQLFPFVTVPRQNELDVWNSIHDKTGSFDQSVQRFREMKSGSAGHRRTGMNSQFMSQCV
jgi:hypothetical protein